VIFLDELVKRIEIDPEKLGGQPVIKGTRNPVTQILAMLANDWTVDEILKNFPELTEEDIKAAILYAKKILEKIDTHPLPGRR